ncbi:universal stress protein [Algoriphagus sediminis]|uniref:Universal stress protein n=1 Tax=Algoriphagus sediminis TaxID=3057113 RepID=A0ABT7YBE2_9BACT|nr:universal stress protein [Algoriphagus sediminis]MDN3203828.1 universal stress protein [Algoriphagus sediminis]
MKNFSKALVGLDLTEMDDVLIKKTILFLEFLGIEKCYFIHVSKNLAIPQEIIDNYPDLVAPGDESVEAIMKDKLHQFNFPSSVEVEVFAEEGDHPLDTFLRWARIKDVDLIVMGRKETLEGSGSLAKGVAKKAPCSILMLQEKRPPGLPEKIMVPTDFSSHNHMIFEFGERIASEMNAEMVPVNIYEVPHGYSKTGKSFEEFSAIMKKNAQTDYKNFLKEHQNKKVKCQFILRKKNHDGEILLAHAEEIEADMILIGSRGKSKSAALMLGSTAEELIEVNNKIPMLIFKKKGENIGFFEALFKI